MHAVPRPVLPPVTTLLLSGRQPGATEASFVGVVDVHAGSTDRIEAEAEWVEWLDDLGAAGPTSETRRSVAFHAQVDPDEDMLLLSVDDTATTLPGVRAVRTHRARHEFGDTRHRVVRYRFRATTRFREYFPPPLVAALEDRSVVGAETLINQPSTVAPPPVTVEQVLPLFRWDDAVDPGQPFGIRRRRRAGLRVYLARPWFRTGADEQLAVVLSSAERPLKDHVSVWAADPIWFNAGPANQTLLLGLEDFLGSIGVDRVRGPDKRLSPPALAGRPSAARLAGAGGDQAFVLGYRPEYSAERRLWFVDVDIDPAAAHMPFVRLAVARYQPHALPGLELSPVSLCPFAQLPPVRTMTVSRPDERSARVTVTGAVGMRDGLTAAPDNREYPLGLNDPTHALARDRRVWAVLERRGHMLGTDLDWDEVKRLELTFGGIGPGFEFAWTGVVDLGQALALAEPGHNADWRLTVEEHETMVSDPDDMELGSPLRHQSRLVYADRTLL